VLFRSFHLVLETRRLFETHLISSKSLLKTVSPKVHKVLLILGTEKKFPLMVDDASCHLSCYIPTHASIWHRYRDVAPQK